MKINTKKIVAGGMLTALAVSLSGFAIPIGASKCFPIQHLCNVITGVFLGPVYGVGMAFATSLIRNLLGTGSLLAFPGSMVGAYLCAVVYQHTGKLSAAYAGEVFGTGILGGILCYPVASWIMGKEAALFAYVLPFLVSTAGGTLMAAILIGARARSGAMRYVSGLLEGESR